MSTYYEILEVSENASAEVIKASYRALMRKFHPDVYKGDKDFATEQVKIINEAYEVLSDPQKRALYDSYLKSVHESRGFAKNSRNNSYHQDHEERNENKETSYGEKSSSFDNNNENKTEGRDNSFSQTRGTNEIK